MLKVVLIHNRLVIGGPAIAIAHAIYLQPQYQFYLIVGKPLPDEQDAAYLFSHLTNVTIIYLPSMHRTPSIFKDYITYNKIKKIIKELAPKVVHTHGSKPGILGRLAAYNLKVPTIIHTYHGHIFHSYFNKLISKCIVYLERYMAARTTYIIAISHTLYTQLTSQYRIAPPAVVKVIPLTIPLAKFYDAGGSKQAAFRAMYHIRPHHICIGIVGRITPIKNMGMYINVIIALKSKSYFNNLRFFVIGDGNDKQQLMHQLTTHNITYTETNNALATVQFTSWHIHTHVVMNGLNILCLTSLNEGTPVAIIEAMAASKPIVSTHAGSVHELVTHGVNGYVVPHNQVAAFAQALDELITDSNKRVQFGIQSHSKVHTYFNNEHNIALLNNIYQS